MQNSYLKIALKIAVQCAPDHELLRVFVDTAKERVIHQVILGASKSLIVQPKSRHVSVEINEKVHHFCDKPHHFCRKFMIF